MGRNGSGEVGILFIEIILLLFLNAEMEGSPLWSGQTVDKSATDGISPSVQKQTKADNYKGPRAQD